MSKHEIIEHDKQPTPQNFNVCDELHKIADSTKDFTERDGAVCVTLEYVNGDHRDGTIRTGTRVCNLSDYEVAHAVAAIFDSHPGAESCFIMMKLDAQMGQRHLTPTSEQAEQ